MVSFRSDLSGDSTYFPHFWERVVGSGHAPLALRADWQQQLQRCRRELGFDYVRFHGLLSHPMSTLVKHGGEPVYSPVDFITTHYYPTDAFGKVGAPTEKKLADTSPDVMGRRAREARQQARGRPLYYTEWNIASNPRHELHDLPFAAGSVINILMSVSGCVEGYSYWTFSDIFEELYFPSEPFHGGFGLLTLHGMAKPVFRAFQILHSLGAERLPVHGDHETVSCWVVRKNDEVTVLIINYAQPRRPIKTESVYIHLQHAAQPASAVVRRIDADHANPRRTWEEMGQPRYLSHYQVSGLKVASQLHSEPLAWEEQDGGVRLALDVPPQGVAAVTVTLPDTEHSE